MNNDHSSSCATSSGDCGLSEYIAASKYARYSEALGRREVWSEAAARVEDMHLSRFPDANIGAVAGLPTSLHAAIRSAFSAVAKMEVLPSMRSLQFGGKAVLRNNARIYNCSFSYCDRLDFFNEAFWLLLCGCGVGFSVQKAHVAKLPPLAALDDWSVTSPETHVVADTIEGWADALKALVYAHVGGRTMFFDYSMIRPAGEPLKASGGKAPGPEPLRVALDSIRTVLMGAAGRQLRTVEAYDIVMFSAKAVLSGGIRRSATICLFSADDAEMMDAKTGNWFETNPQRSASNNSAVLIRGTTTRDQFDALFTAQKEFGEPGFYFADDPDYGSNPCVEIGLNPRLTVMGDVAEKLRAYGYKGDLFEGQVLTGWQTCNLSSVVGRLSSTPAKFYQQCAHAALIGTLQAAYTNFKYLSPVSRLITENEALLGVSIGGILDNPEVLLTPAVLEHGAAITRQVNAAVAAAIGINAAARVTCVKPDGNTGLLTNSGSGIGPHHSRRYFRRVQANKLDPLFQHWAAANPSLVEDSVYDKSGATAVMIFAVEGPEHGIFREDLTALKHLELVSLVQRHWVMAGRANETYSPGLHHNVSNTINVVADEWSAVADFIWANRSTFTGVALLAATGDRDYAQAPREAAVTPEDLARWHQVRLRFRTVDFTALEEAEDSTTHKQESACAGGACAI